jgi:hypothetical protein
MATITKRTSRRSNGTKGCAWIVSYSDPHKRRHIRTFPTKAEAEIWRREELRRVPITVAEAGATWLAQCEGEGLQAATIRQYRQHLDLHIGPVIGSRTLVDRPRHIDVNYLATSRNLWRKPIPSIPPADPKIMSPKSWPKLPPR